MPAPTLDGPLRIAILGAVTPQRRDYLAVIEALGAATFTRPVELHLLGACNNRDYGLQVEAAIERISNALLSVKFDREHGYIPHDELVTMLKRMHLLLSPIRLDFSFQLYRERYGLTKISGAESDCTAFNRPVLLPRNYLYSRRIAPYVIEYGSDDELIAAINDLTDGKCLAALQDRIAAHPATEANRNMLHDFLNQLG